MNKLSKLSLKELEKAVAVIEDQRWIVGGVSGISDIGGGGQLLPSWITPGAGSYDYGSFSNMFFGDSNSQSFLAAPPRSSENSTSNKSNSTPVSYNSATEAYSAATNLSCETHKECGGLVFADGTAVLYQSDKATHDTNPPLLPTNSYCIDGEDVSVYNGSVIQSNFHTHPDNSIPGRTDRNIQSTYYPNCDMAILYGNNVTTYHYEEGFLVPYR